MTWYHTDCRHFGGYKPCRYHRGCDGCGHFERPQPDVLLINLDRMGDVLRTTALLAALRRQHPCARVTWLTSAAAAPLLALNPMLDRVMIWGSDALAELAVRHFDLLLSVDKSPTAGAVASRTSAADKRGFGLDPCGAILPLNPEAAYLYDTGLDDTLKFRINALTEPEMLAGAMGLPYHRDPYTLVLSDEERSAGPARRVGFNTGCSPDFAHKRLALELQAEAIRRIAARTGEPVLLLGGPEDTARNRKLAEQLGPLAELTPTELGVRRGAAEVARCEVVFTGDSLGMHLALAMGCHVVAWFGVSCPQEIELYDRGIKLLADVGCAPCWKSQCDVELPCSQRVDPDLIETALLDALSARSERRPLNEVRGSGWWRPRTA